MRLTKYILMVVFALCTGGLIAVIAAPELAPKPDNNDADLAFQPNPGAQLPLSAKLVDENGRSVTLGRYFSKTPVILVLEYLRCTSLCGVTLRNIVFGALNNVPLQAGRDYQFVAISIDPRDAPADAKAAQAKYAAMLDHGGGLGLHFLTGSKAAVRKIADTVGFHYRYDSLLDAYIHPAGFIIASPAGLISRYVEGVAISPQDLIATLAGAQQDKTQGLLTRIFLLCHIQGAPLGRYTVPVMAALTIANVGAGLTLIGLFTAIHRQS